jgi:hypothetical protein
VLGRKYVGFKDYLSETIRASKGSRSCGNRPGDMHGDVLAYPSLWSTVDSIASFVTRSYLLDMFTLLRAS